jgi:hypothetical protein
MLDNGGLAPAGHKDQLLDACLTRLVHRILNQRPVDDRKHFLGDRLGSGEKTRAHPGYGEHRLADRLALRLRCIATGHVVSDPLVERPTMALRSL